MCQRKTPQNRPRNTNEEFLSNKPHLQLSTAHRATTFSHHFFSRSQQWRGSSALFVRRTLYSRTHTLQDPHVHDARDIPEFTATFGLRRTGPVLQTRRNVFWITGRSIGSWTPMTNVGHVGERWLRKRLHQKRNLKKRRPLHGVDASREGAQGRQTSRREQRRSRLRVPSQHLNLPAKSDVVVEAVG